VSTVTAVSVRLLYVCLQGGPILPNFFGHSVFRLHCTAVYIERTDVS